LEELEIYMTRIYKYLLNLVLMH